jgi:probable rRNA maturation factor
MRLARGQGLDEVDIIIEAEGWTRALPTAEAVVGRAAAAALSAATPGGGHWQAAVLLADDATLRDLNRRFRGQDKPTNVLSFPAQDDSARHAGAGSPRLAGEEPRSWGDVALAFETVAREAAEQGKSLADHLSHLVVHGLLHLFGHDHEEAAAAERMEALERRILRGLGIADPYAAEQPA